MVDVGFAGLFENLISQFGSCIDLQDCTQKFPVNRKILISTSDNKMPLLVYKVFFLL